MNREILISDEQLATIAKALERIKGEDLDPDADDSATVIFDMVEFARTSPKADLVYSFID